MREYHIYMQRTKCVEGHFKWITYKWLPWEYVGYVEGTKELYTYFKSKFPYSINSIDFYNSFNYFDDEYLKIDNKNTIVDQSEIKFIKRDGMKLIFHTTNKDYEIYSSFNKIQDSLPGNFVRCHKSFIANIDNISNIEPVENKIFFDNDFSCDIGPKYKKDLLEAVNKYGDF